MKFYELLQPRTICEAISLFLAAAICCGISAGKYLIVLSLLCVYAEFCICIRSVQYLKQDNIFKDLFF